VSDSYQWPVASCQWLVLPIAEVQVAEGGLLPENVGRRIYLSGQTDIVMEPDETRRKRDMYPMIAELRDLLNFALLYDVDYDTYPLGEPRLGRAMIPSFESEADLEKYCRQNIDAFRRQSKPS